MLLPHIVTCIYYSLLIIFRSFTSLLLVFLFPMRHLKQLMAINNSKNTTVHRDTS